DQAADRLADLVPHRGGGDRLNGVAVADVAQVGAGCGAVNVVAEPFGFECGVVSDAGQVVGLGLLHPDHAGSALGLGGRLLAAVRGGLRSRSGHGSVLLFFREAGRKARRLACPRAGHEAMVTAGTGGSGGSLAGGGVRRSDLLGAEGPHDLAVAVDPRCVDEVVNLHEVIYGQPGLVSGHFDPDGLRGTALVIDRGQPHHPDRSAIRRHSVLALPLLGPRRPASAEPDIARFDLQTHGVLPLSVWLLSCSRVGYDPKSRLDKFDCQVGLFYYPAQAWLSRRK